MLLCDECGVWPLGRRDRFCGWCGSPLLELALLRPADGAVVRRRDYVSPGETERVYLLRQRGALAHRTPVVRAGGRPVAVEPTERPGVHQLRVPLPAHIGAPTRLVLDVRDADGAETRTLELALWPTPEVVPRPDAGSLQLLVEGRLQAAFVDARAPSERLTLRVASPAAPVVPRRFGIRLPEEELPRWDVDGDLVTEALELRLPDLGREVGLARELPIELSRRGPWGRGQQRAFDLLIDFEGLAVWTLPVVLVQRRRTGGDLQPEAIELPTAYRGRLSQVPAQLRNDDDFDLELVEIVGEPPWIRAVEYRVDARPETLGPLPLPLPLPAAAKDGGPAGAVDFTVLVDGTHPRFPAAGEGPIAGQLSLIHRSGARAVLPVRVGVVSEPEALSGQHGYLAIDFGTTNTCCAIKLPERDVEIVPFGGGRTSIPSVLFFEDLSDPARPKVKVGDEALAHAKAHGERSLLRNFKRRIGLDVREQVTDPRGQAASFLPDELATLFLAEVLRRVREHLDRRGVPVEVDAIFFTYPVLFGPRQIERLTAIFQGLGAVDVRPAMDEASAGAVEAIHRWAGAEYRDLEQPGGEPVVEYVLNYDFGGGTIDVALLEVVKDFAHRLVTSTPIGVTGLHRFGGEDITVAVRRMIVRRVERTLRQRHPRFSLPCGDPADPPGLYQVKRENNARLAFLADKVKIRAFADGEYTIHPDDPDLDGLWVDFGEGAGCERVDAARRPLFAGCDPGEARVQIRRAEIERVIEPHVRGSVERAYNLFRASPATSLSRVLLTGRSSSIPIVRRLLAERFGLDEDQLAHDPDSAKEVVAQGACYFRQLWGARIRGLRFAMGSIEERVLIPIGLEQIDFDASVFEPIFDGGTRLQKVADGAGNDWWYAETSVEFGLVGPLATIKVFRSLDYVDPIASGGKDLIAQFDLRADDPFFADWTLTERAAFPVTFRLWRAAGGSTRRVEVVVRHPRHGTEKALHASFEGDLVAAVGADEEAAGLLVDALDELPDRREDAGW